ncbi:Bifunctional protein FolD protein [Chlamydia avium]|uniref:Tetrahydrofolate dehydrogenase/cyclohydrolase, NAD(P)-binding domain protein n=1 Tax=Chlamydia avium TaxID=1457141 RepID=A0ABN0MRE8_9CHLA|nr:tetrahydrofolate dehydrogenase [Chlamydia avium]EPP38041.1 tetrahydrofolate dehydrogenase/cyclohydrolase, NAD(P)-binding domain protein [Chlamydia avium]VVT42734.1 Bifunctional protein FolD protein [Chlamydia avium]
MQKYFPPTTVSIFPDLSKTLTKILQTTDIIVSALGIPLFVKGHMLSPHTVVIDPGLSYIEVDNNTKYTPLGDFECNTAVTRCREISPIS